MTTASAHKSSAEPPTLLSKKNIVENLSNQIGRLRTAQGLTQEALAAVAGVSLDTVKRYENKRTGSPDFYQVYRIAHALGVTLDDLIMSSEKTIDPQKDKLKALLNAAVEIVDRMK